MTHVGNRHVPRWATPMDLVLQSMCRFLARNKKHTLTVFDSITEMFACVSVAKF